MKEYFFERFVKERSRLGMFEGSAFVL